MNCKTLEIYKYFSTTKHENNECDKGCSENEERIGRSEKGE